MIEILGIEISGLVATVLGVAIITLALVITAIASKEMEDKSISFVLVIITAMVLAQTGGFVMFSGENRGVPNNKLPSENIPLVIKTVDWEDPEGSVYLTVVPYNNMNGTRTFYEISQDDISTPINLSVGMKIVNNGGTIEQV